jgi:tetratricopeptide (TPR) repeat protein
MHRKRNRVKIVFSLIFFFGIIVFAQDKPVNVNENKQLKEEILAAYQSGGKQGLRDFVKKNKDNISNKFIKDFAKAGRKKRKEVWLKVCEIIAEEKNEKKTLADVLYNTGKYFYWISENEKAIEYYDKALRIYLKLNDPVGLGNMYKRKGRIYFETGNNSRALEMYDKALLFYEKAGTLLGQGNVHTEKGRIYFYTGDKSRALEMYNKALPLFQKAGNLTGQGNVYTAKGRIYSSSGDHSRALEMYDKALLFYEKAGSPLGQSNVYFCKGTIYASSGDNSRALDMYDKALLFYEKAGILPGQGNVYIGKGRIYFAAGNNSRALEMFDKALTLFQKAGNLTGQGDVYLGKGRIYSSTGDQSRAFEMCYKALLFYEKAGSPLGQGNVYFCKGQIYASTGDNSRALEMFDKALTFFQIAGDPLGQGNVYKGKGTIYLDTGNNSRALEMFDKALTSFQKAGNLTGQGSVYKGKGKIYSSTGNNSRALEMFDKALTLFQKAENPVGQGDVYFRKGTIYDSSGDNSRALDMYDKALTFFQIAGDPYGQGNVYIGKGEIYFETGNNSRALEMYDKALPFFEKAGEPRGQGNVYLSKGRIYRMAGDHSRALEMGDKALTFFEKAGEPRSQGRVYVQKGMIYSTAGDKSRALEMFDKALFLYKKSGVVQSESGALHSKAKVLVKLGKKEKARHLFEKGIAYLETVRTQTAFSEMKKTFMETVYQQYEETVLFMLENKHDEKGFKYAESMRARVFLDRMAEGLVRLERGLTPDLREKRDKLMTKLSQLSKQMHKTGGKKEITKLQDLKEQYRKTEREFEDLLVKIRLNNPLYASVRYPEPITVRALQTKVLNKDELLLHYFISPAKLYVSVITKGSFKVVPITIKEKEIKGIVKRFLSAIKENSPGEMRRFGKTLYKKLFKPLENTIKECRDIIIVPHGDLAAIPFESLIIDKEKSGRPVFLLEKYRVKYIQSASLLSVLRKHYQRDKKTKNFIGFGDPVYDYKKFKQGKPEQGSVKIFATESTEVTEDEIKEMYRSRYARAGGVLPRLKGSGEEVKSIARLFKGESQKWAAHLRENAAEEIAKVPDMKDFDYIHFACHGLLNDDFQCLVLSQDIPQAKDDGYFTLNEIMNCDYNAKLVVLSACQTGSGKMYRGEGITGLTRAFMYAGSPAVVVSLWDVDDKATKELMVKFYKNMLEKNLNETEALRQAKLELLKNKKYSSPLFWSAFVLYGE